MSGIAAKPQFVSNILALFQTVIKNHGFKASTATATATFCAFVSRVTEDVCYYIFVRDDRAGQGTVAIDLWVAPTDFPDDRLDALGVGYRIRVAMINEPSDEFFSASVKRLELVLPKLTGFVDAVRSELTRPLVTGRRLMAYQFERGVWASVRASTSGAVSAARAQLEQAVSRSIADQASLKSSESYAVNLAETVFADRSLLSDADRRFLAEDRELLADILTSQSYIEVLAPSRGAVGRGAETT